MDHDEDDALGGARKSFSGKADHKTLMSTVLILHDSARSDAYSQSTWCAKPPFSDDDVPISDGRSPSAWNGGLAARARYGAATYFNTFFRRVKKGKNTFLLTVGVPGGFPHSFIKAKRAG